METTSGHLQRFYQESKQNLQEYAIRLYGNLRRQIQLEKEHYTALFLAKLPARIVFEKVTF